MKYVTWTIGLVIAVVLGSCGDAADDDGGQFAAREAAVSTSAANQATEKGTTGASNQAADEASGDEVAAAPSSPDRSRLADGLNALLIEIITGKVGLEPRDVLEERVEGLLEEMRYGDVTSRSVAAADLIDQIINEIEMAGLLGANPVTSLSALQKQAVKGLAQQFAADLETRFTTGGSQHEGSFMAAVDFETPEGYIRGNWSVLGGFEYKEGMELPEGVKKLDGKKVAIAGYMMSLGEYSDVHKFLLVESVWSCCFGIPPDVHQVVVVRIPDALPGIELTSMPVLCLGTLDVGEEYDGRWVTSVYRLEATDVHEIE